MRKEQIKSLGDADIYFVQQGAVGYFDSLFPKLKYDDETKIFKRHYFKPDHHHVGYYVPSFENAGPKQSMTHYTNDQDHWRQHPNLVKLLARM